MLYMEARAGEGSYEVPGYDHERRGSAFQGSLQRFLGYHVDDAQFTRLWSMLLDMAAAARNDVNVDEELYAVRELMRLNLKRQGDAHAWLAPRPDQDKTRLSNREAIDWIS